MNLPFTEMDHFLSEHEHMFEDAGVITSQLYNKMGDNFWD